MGKDLYEAEPVARAILDRADEVLGFSLTSLMFDGPEEDLTETQNQQPAILAHSAACLALLEAKGVTPTIVAGHSLGEYSALMAAGALGFEDALLLVRKRGELMSKAGGGAMAAVLGPDLADVEAACEAAREVGTVLVANHNCPGQLVISGEPDAVAEASRVLKDGGAKRVIALRVSGAFHSPLMQPAADELRPVLDGAPFAEASVPLVSNVDAISRTDGGEIREALAQQMVSQVRWETCVRAMIDAGADAFIEVGPGKALSGMIRRIDESVETVQAGTTESIASI